MAIGLSAAAVVLMLLVQNSEAMDVAVQPKLNEAELPELVANLLNVYKPTDVNGNPPMFSLAISIPFNTGTNRYDFSQVTAADSGPNVRNTLNQCKVYEGSRVVASTLLKWPVVLNQCPNSDIPNHWAFVKEACPDARIWADVNRKCIDKIKKKSPSGGAEHAEYRVLQKIDTLVNGLNTRLNKNDLMLFYVYKSPCDGRCTNDSNAFNILTAIRNITNWNNFAVVFSGIFVPVASSFTTTDLENNRRNSLTNLNVAINHVGNIYRCVEGSTQCSRCIIPGGVASACVSDHHVDSHSHIGK